MYSLSLLGSDKFDISNFQLLRIEMPDGSLIRVVDFAGQYYEFRRARDYEANLEAQSGR
jgi:hypothetical protein